MTFDFLTNCGTPYQVSNFTTKQFGLIDWDDYVKGLHNLPNADVAQLDPVSCAPEMFVEGGVHHDHAVDLCQLQKNVGTYYLRTIFFERWSMSYETSESASCSHINNDRGIAEIPAAITKAWSSQSADCWLIARRRISARM